MKDRNSTDGRQTTPAMRALLDTAARVAGSVIPVLLLGETGTGKEVLARLIHDGGPRRNGPLLCVNCGALVESLIASSLFGHERGAFTGASEPKKGVFEEARGGSVLLDEIGELPLAAQASLLRVLETKVVTRVGSNREIPVDVRVLAATHRDLEAMCEDGRFRQDLLYRLNTVTLAVPPLRERRQEVAPLAHRFLEQAAGRNIRSIAPATLTLLEAYRWPGNVRELRNAMERAVAISDRDVILPEDLPAAIQSPASDVDSSAVRSFRDAVRRFERHTILEALRGADWNRKEAADRLGVPLRTLAYKMRMLGLRRLRYDVSIASGGKELPVQGRAEHPGRAPHP